MTNALYAEIDRLKAECDGYRNGQGQLQSICDGLYDSIKKYADERKELRAENERLHKEANTTMKELCRLRGQLAKIRALIVKRAGK